MASRQADWLRVREGILNGDLLIGSREPIRSAPLWATPRVVNGGFVTGELLATLTPDDKPNSYYLSNEGIEQLHSWLD